MLLMCIVKSLFKFLKTLFGRLFHCEKQVKICTGLYIAQCLLLTTVKPGIMKILLATDGSPYSERAVKEMVERKFPENTEVHVISVYEATSLSQKMESMGTLREYHAELDKKAKEYAEGAAESAAKRLQENNSSLFVTKVVVAGSPKKAILNEAEKSGINLIVMGSHGYGAIKSFLLGSVSHAVVLHANCSVEIIR